MSQGRAYPQPVLDAALGRHRGYAATALYRAMSTAIARMTMWWIGRGLAQDVEIH